MLRYLAKMRGRGTAPPRPATGQILWSWIGAALGIGIVAALAAATGTPLLMAPFGATCVLVFGLPDSPLAQPRSIVGGHLLSSFVGLAFLHVLGSGPWSMALAVPTAIAAMQLTRTVHAPAGANPLLIIASGADWDFLITPVLAGSLLLVATAAVVNNLSGARRYPAYWM
jgi:CBS-domain-containing membrane protein